MAPDLDAAGYDRLIGFMESPRYQLLQQQFTRETVEHLLIRLGFRMHGPDAHNEIQEQMAFLRRLWLMRPSLEDRVDRLEQRLEAAENLQADRFKSILNALNEKHAENSRRHDSSDAERKEIKTDVSKTKNATLAQLVVVLLGVIGVLVMRYVLP